jgi:acyl-CoA reductase-like NAD-dependent aldehyde dehydrogenase
VCVASKRLYVHNSIYEQFMNKFVAETKKLQSGQGYVSPIQNSMQWDKLKSLYADCVDQKYEFALGDGKLPSTDKSGNFAPPTIIARPPEKSRIVQEEPFGPIVPVLTWDDEDDVIERANDSLQGLGATLYCKDPKTAERIAEQLDAGSIWVNRGVKPLPTALFGGSKQSGIGGEWGPLGLLGYCQAKTLHFAKV